MFLFVESISVFFYIFRIVWIFKKMFCLTIESLIQFSIEIFGTPIFRIAEHHLLRSILNFHQVDAYTPKIESASLLLEICYLSHLSPFLMCTDNSLRVTKSKPFHQVTSNYI